MPRLRERRALPEGIEAVAFATANPAHFALMGMRVEEVGLPLIEPKGAAVAGGVRPAHPPGARLRPVEERQQPDGRVQELKTRGNAVRGSFGCSRCRAAKPERCRCTFAVLVFPWSALVHLASEKRRRTTTMSELSQISATVSAATKEMLDRFSESHGLRKNFVVEQALLYFMEARRELPDEALIPVRLVLDDKVFDRVVDLLERPPAPTDALRELMRGQDR